MTVTVETPLTTGVFSYEVEPGNTVFINDNCGPMIKLDVTDAGVHLALLKCVVDAPDGPEYRVHTIGEAART